MLEKLLNILEDVCDDDAFRTDFDLDLFEEDLMDSLGLTELLLALEENFSLVISPTEYEKNDFSTVNKINGILIEKGIVG